MCIRDRLVTEASQQGLSVRRVAVALAALWLVSVDDAQDAAAGPIVSDDNLERICGCGEDAADLWYGLESVEYIDRVGIPKQQNEDVSCADGQGVIPGQCDQVIIRSGAPHQANPRCFVERQPELHARHGVHHSLVAVLDTLDEVRLPDDDVHVLVLRDCYQLQLHGITSTCIVAPEVVSATSSHGSVSTDGKLAWSAACSSAQLSRTRAA